MKSKSICCCHLQVSCSNPPVSWKNSSKFAKLNGKHKYTIPYMMQIKELLFKLGHLIAVTGKIDTLVRKILKVPNYRLK